MGARRIRRRRRARRNTKSDTVHLLLLLSKRKGSDAILQIAVTNTEDAATAPLPIDISPGVTTVIAITLGRGLTKGDGKIVREIAREKIVEITIINVIEVTPVIAAITKTGRTTERTWVLTCLCTVRKSASSKRPKDSGETTQVAIKMSGG